MDKPTTASNRAIQISPNAFRLGYSGETPPSLVFLEFGKSLGPDASGEGEPETLAELAISPTVFSGLLQNMLFFAMHYQEKFSVDLLDFINKEEGGAGDEQS